MSEPANGPVPSPTNSQAPIAANSHAGSATVEVPVERRKRNIPVAFDRRAKNAAEKRKNSARRRLIDPTTCERDYTDDEIEFMQAMDRYKRENRRPFPTWSEVLEVLRALGYRKVAEPTPLPKGKRTPQSAPVSTNDLSTLPPKG